MVYIVLFTNIVNAKENYNMIQPQKLAAIVADQQMMLILSITGRRDSSVLDICNRTGMSIAACYRKVNYLRKNGLIKCTKKVLTREGKRIRLYRSMVSQINIIFENSKMKVKLRKVEEGENEGLWTVSNLLSKQFTV